MAARYPVRNWNVYNKALCDRGNISIWLDEVALQSWRAQFIDGKRGAQFVYSDAAVELALTLRAIYHLPLRQTVGFLQGIFKLGSIDLPVPCYSTISRRSASLEIELPCSEEPVHLVIDSTGFKVYGEGEWKVRVHGMGKRRTWRKLHISLNADNHEIVSAIVTTNDIHDSRVLPELVAGKSSAMTVSGDGAYDTKICYERISSLGAHPLIPPRKGALLSQHGNCKQPPVPRDENIRGIRQLGRRRWKQESGYHRRSLVETAMYRMKTIFGDRLRSRTFNNQATEALLKCKILNDMTAMGMPHNEAIAVE